MAKDKNHPEETRLNRIQLCFSAAFLIIVIVISAANVKHGTLSLLDQLRNPLAISKESISQTEDSYNDAFYRRDLWIAFHGGIQRVLQKYENNNFDVVKDRSGFLHMPVESLDDGTLTAYADNLAYFYDRCSSLGIPLLYVQAPSDYVPGFTRLPAGMDYDRIANGNIDRFLSLVESRGIPYLDVRNILDGLNAEDLFYKTDHHWAMPLTFRTFREILAKLEVLSDIPLDPNGQYRDLSRYTTLALDSSFLGSRGIRTGALYAGKDSFPICIPAYDTEFVHAFYKDGEQKWVKEGTFSDVFLDASILNQEDYNNKYNALMYTSNNESVITNLRAQENTRCLVIADSFGRQLVPYLSQCFHQTAYLDPQTGRYADSMSEYIDTFRPDCVVVLFNGDNTYIPIPE